MPIGTPEEVAARIAPVLDVADELLLAPPNGLQRSADPCLRGGDRRAPPARRMTGRGSGGDEGVAPASGRNTATSTRADAMANTGRSPSNRSSSNCSSSVTSITSAVRRSPRTVISITSPAAAGRARWSRRSRTSRCPPTRSRSCQRMVDAPAFRDSSPDRVTRATDRRGHAAAGRAHAVEAVGQPDWRRAQRAA